MSEGNCPLGSVMYGDIVGIYDRSDGITTSIPICLIMNGDKALTSIGDKRLFVLHSKSLYADIGRIGVGNQPIKMVVHLQQYASVDDEKYIEVDVNNLVTVYQPDVATISMHDNITD